MPSIQGIRITYGVDGVTPTGCAITPPGGGAEILVNVSNSPGATPSAVETAANNILRTAIPTCAWAVHCFSVSPFSIAVWCGNPGTVPANATWWLG